MEIRIIKTPKDYLQSLERFEEVFQAVPGTAESDEAGLLIALLRD